MTDWFEWNGKEMHRVMAIHGNQSIHPSHCLRKESTFHAVPGRFRNVTVLEDEC